MLLCQGLCKIFHLKSFEPHLQVIFVLKTTITMLLKTFYSLDVLKINLHVSIIY
jgi:hypothetical protein